MPPDPPRLSTHICVLKVTEWPHHYFLASPSLALRTLRKVVNFMSFRMLYVHPLSLRYLSREACITLSINTLDYAHGIGSSSCDS